MTATKGLHEAALAAAPARGYRDRVIEIASSLIRDVGPVDRALDFGSGDGYVANRLEADGLAREIVCVDVTKRQRAFREVQLYEGKVLPFPERSFALVYAVDVLHHCEDPSASLRELCRISNDLVLLKDHTYDSSLGKATLCVLDELGNRRFGIPSVYKYQRGWSWDAVMAQEGFGLVKRVHPADCEQRAWGRFTNKLQYVGLWKRI